MSTATSAITASTATIAIERVRVEPASPRPARVAGGLAWLLGEAKCESHGEGASRCAQCSIDLAQLAPASFQQVGYSIPSGPLASPERNCRTNWLSELNSSSAGPDSTIRPFQRIAMYSATLRADMMSCVITT